MKDEPSTWKAGLGGNAKREKNMRTIPVRSHKRKRENSGLTIVRVRLNESGLLVGVGISIVRGSPTISMKCLGHDTLRGHVQCVYLITAVPIGLSLVTQAYLLGNLHRLDNMVAEEVAKKCRHTITWLGLLEVFVESRASHVVGAVIAPRSVWKVVAKS